jgi:hypothetical protein
MSEIGPIPAEGGAVSGQLQIQHADDANYTVIKNGVAVVSSTIRYVFTATGSSSPTPTGGVGL